MQIGILNLGCEQSLLEKKMLDSKLWRRQKKPLPYLFQEKSWECTVYSLKKLRRATITQILDDWLISMACQYVYSYFMPRITLYVHHVAPSAQISLTLSRHSSLSSITSGRSSVLHPVSAQSCCMLVLAGRPAFAHPFEQVHITYELVPTSPSEEWSFIFVLLYSIIMAATVSFGRS